MNIHELSEKIKPHLRQIWIGLCVLISVSLLFAFARLWTLAQNRLEIKLLPATAILSQSGETSQNDLVIGVKTSKKYYFPWCGTLKRAKVSNQVQFDSATSARAAGYVAGGGCAGLQ